MSTLLLRLSAPLQSWGVTSKFDQRNTERAPSKSGILGLCAAALGYRRNEDGKIAELAKLKFGVRIDKPGVLLKDFHTARSGKSAYVTTRYYLSDAAFLAGLEGEDGFLCEIDAAIRAPMFPLYLGRRSCPPEGRISYGVMPGSLREVLENPPFAELRQIPPGTRIVIDDDTRGHFQRDLPLSFNPEHRKFGFRRVYESEVCIVASHDALAELEVPQCT